MAQEQKRDVVVILGQGHAALAIRRRSDDGGRAERSQLGRTRMSGPTSPPSPAAAPVRSPLRTRLGLTCGHPAPSQGMHERVTTYMASYPY